MKPRRTGWSLQVPATPFLLVALILWLVSPGCSARDAGSPGAAPESQGASAVPASLKMAVLRAQQKAEGYAFAADASGVLRAKAGPWGAIAAVEATARGVRIARGGFELAVETTSVGRDGLPASRGVKAVRAEGQELVLDRADDVEERFLAGPLGLEHAFTLRARPQNGRGPLAIEVAFLGLSPELAAGAPDRVLLRDAAGLVRGGYRDLVAVDAGGRELVARMEVREGAVALVIDDAGAAYPVRVDPLVWTQEAELTASDGASKDELGYSVSVSGAIAVIGAPVHQVGSNVEQGTAYVFVQSGTTWTQQAELTASDGAAGDNFGQSVSVSGTTAVVGAPLGAAYVFVQSGTTWTQQAKLTANGGAFGDFFGTSVSVSGTTAVVGAFGHNGFQGAAYVFVQSGTTWTQQAELTANDGAAMDSFGDSVSVSGTTAVVGAYNHQVGSNMQQGAAYVFVQSGTTWTQQAELTANDGLAVELFGSSVSVSGTTAVVGAPYSGKGAAYVFVQSGTTWTQQAELTASDGAAGDSFGWSVSVSGTTAIVSAFQHAAQGAAYVFVQSGTTWTQQAELTASDGAAGDNFGQSVSVSGTTAVVGATDHEVGSNQDQGAAYVFCTPLTACPGPDDCGTIPDGCGGMINCGTCGEGQVCSGNVCVSSTTSSSSGSGGSGTGGSDTGGAGAGTGGTTGNPGQDGGCQCEAAGAPAEAPGASLSALGLLAFAGVMRPRRRQRHRHTLRGVRSAGCIL